MKNNEVKGRTLEVILAEANAKVEELNKERDVEKRLTLEAEVEKLVKEYNELSLLTAYAAAKAEPLPIMALAKACTYSTISKKKTPGDVLVDGVSKKVDIFSIPEKDTNLNILKYIKWLEDRNFKLPKGWIGRMSAVKAEIIDQWQAFDKSGDEHSFNKKQMRRLTQAMVNDMGFIEGEKGGNALVVKNEHINPMIKYANKKTGVQSGKTLDSKTWDDLLMTLLNGLATGTAFENTYGGTAVFKEEPAPAEETAEASEATTQEATVEAPVATAEATATAEVKAE